MTTAEVVNSSVVAETPETVEIVTPYFGPVEITDPALIVPAAVVVKSKKSSIGPINPTTGRNMSTKEMALAVLAAADKEAAAKSFVDFIILNTMEGAALQSSRLSNVRKILKDLGAEQSIIDLFKAPAITTAANEKHSQKSAARLVKRIQVEISGGSEQPADDDDAETEEPIFIPEYYKLKNVYSRLLSYDTTQHPTIGSLVDVMILWSARPAEIMSLQVSDEAMAVGYAKGENAPRLTVTFLPLSQAKKYLDWIQQYKETMPLPTKDGKKYREFLRPFEGLKIKTLRCIGAEYAAYCNTANKNYTNDKELMALRRIALRHIPQVSSAEFYSVVVHNIPEEYKLPQ